MSIATVTYHKLPPLKSLVDAAPTPVDARVQSSSRTPASSSSSSHYIFHLPSGSEADGWKVPVPCPNVRRVASPSEELCLVCGDKASGYHYNALTCEGCKGFFRRSVTRKAVYYCKYGETCDIDMYMRRKCQHCRLRKCVRIGMRVELVIPEEQCRQKREAKKQRKHSPELKEESPEVSSSDGFVSPDGLSEETSGLVGKVVEMERVLRMPSDEVLSQLSAFKSNSPTTSFQHLAELTILDTQLVHDFIRQLPGFQRIDEEDQRILLKTSTTELVILRAARRYDQREEAIIMGNEGKQWRYTSSSYCEAGLGHFSTLIFSFARQLLQLHLDTAEFAMLCAIAVFSDRSGLFNRRVIEEIQEVYVYHVSAYMDTRAGDGRLASLLVLLADLRIFSAEQATDWPISSSQHGFP